MKKVFIKTIFLFLSIALFFSSCSLMQKEEFAQRKYYDFPRAKHNTEGKQTDLVASTVTKNTEDQNSISKPIAISEESASVISNPIQVEKPQALPVPAKKNKPGKLKLHTQENYKTEPTIDFAKYPGLEKTRRYDPAFRLFVMIVLSFILPPLAIYMKQRVSTKWMWLTIALCITAAFLGIVLSYYGIYAGWYLWIPAAIIALLVVFDILKG